MPKIIGGSLQAHREQVRAKVFDALRTELNCKPFEDITLADVAAEAGVGRTAIYNHFADREQLLVAFVEEEAASYVRTLADVVDGIDDPVEALAEFVRLQLRALAEFHLTPGAALASALPASAYRRIAAHADPIGEHLRRIVADGMATGRMADGEVDTVVAMVTAALSARQVVDVPPERLDEAIEAAVEFVARAVGVKSR